MIFKQVIYPLLVAALIASLCVYLLAMAFGRDLRGCETVYRGNQYVILSCKE